jgi:hypothetical protein
MWTSETQDEYAEAMESADREEHSGLVLVADGELDMDALASLFS